jgi:uncharacterized protein YndB with AHSA1/START domain
MSFDLSAHLGVMTRTVRKLEHDGKPAEAVIASCVYATDAADLWDAVTRPERIKRWFSPVSGDLRLGGRYQVENNAGGTITDCQVNQSFSLTWEFGGATSWVTVTLTPEANGTRLELEHMALVDSRWDRGYGAGAVGVGWDLGFMGLSRHLAEPKAEVALEAVESWFGTPEAKDFIRATSDGWGRAELTAGKPEAEALAAAERTRQFYTGEAPPAEI